MLSKYERGERPPSLLKAIRFADIYKTTVEDLFPELFRQEKTDVARLRSK
jgi:transcriptional regulator with XRE-family HTH domain